MAIPVFDLPLYTRNPSGATRRELNDEMNRIVALLYPLNAELAALVVAQFQQVFDDLDTLIGNLPSGFAPYNVKATVDGQTDFTVPEYPVSQPDAVVVFLNGAFVPRGASGWDVPAEDAGDETSTTIRLAHGVLDDDEVSGLVMPLTRAEVPSVSWADISGKPDFADPITVTVGTLGQFATINEALAYLDGKRRTFGQGATATVHLLSGHVVNEQIIVRGNDLGWITITAADAVTMINPAGVTTAIAVIDNARPLFGAVGIASSLPVLGCLLDYGDNSMAWDGIAIYGGAVAEIKPGCGIIRCRRGIAVYNGARVICNIDGLRGDGIPPAAQVGVIFSNCADRALDVQQGGFANLPRSNFNDAGSTTPGAVYVIWGSHANLYQSDIRRAAGSAITCRDGSFVDARVVNVDQAGDRAIHCLHGSWVNARAKTGGANGFGIHGASNCQGSIAILAHANSLIECPEINVANASARAINASSGSTINCEDAIATNAGTFAVRAVDACVINAARIAVSGAGDTGFLAEGASTINAVDAVANNCALFGAQATTGSTINASGLTANGCDRAVEAQDGCTINARGATLMNSISRAISAIDGSRIDCRNAITAGAVSFELTVRSGSIVHARGYTGAIDLRDGGGTVYNAEGTGTVTIDGGGSVNTVTPNGIVFR